jgi:hypothetical protein
MVLGPTQQTLQLELAFVPKVKDSQSMNLSSHLYLMPVVTIRGTYLHSPVHLYGAQGHEADFSSSPCATDQKTWSFISMSTFFHPNSKSPCLLAPLVNAVIHHPANYFTTKSGAFLCWNCLISWSHHAVASVILTESYFLK